MATEEEYLPDLSSSSIAADDAAIKVQLAMALQKYQALFHNVQLMELSVAAKKEKNKMLDEMIEAKKLELDRVKKMREDVQKRTVSIQQSVANSAALLELQEARRAIILQQRETIRAGYQRLIDKKKAKINKYPLVVERDTLKNQVLVANVELGVLKYRNAEKKRQNELKKEIEEKQRNNAIVDLAQICVNVKKLEEENSCLLQQLEVAENPLIPSEGQDETGLAEITDAIDSINELPPDEPSINLDNQATDSLPTNEQPVNVQSNGVDGVLKNYREKFQVRMRASSVLPPPVLSVETRYGDLKSGPSAQEISASANEKSDATEKSTNKEEMSKTDGDECDLNDSGEVVTQQDESTTNDSMQDANVRPRNAVSKSASVTSTSSAERKRAAFPNAAEHGVKYMKTDDFVGARKLSERHQYPTSDPIDEGIMDDRQLGTIIARHSGRRLAGVRSAARARREMESALSPEKTGSYPAAQENNVVPSTYFQAKPVERRPRRVYDQSGLNYGNDGANRTLERDVDDRRASGIKKNLAGEGFGADERGYAPEEEFDFRSDNGDGFDNYSDHNDEIDADEEYIGAPQTGYDDGRPTYPTRVCSKEKSSSEGVVSGQSGKPPSFDQDIFGSSNEREPSPLLFANFFLHSGDRKDREDLF